jgi:hypothetical protein
MQKSLDQRLNYWGQNKVKLFVMKPAGFRFAETYYLSPSLPFNLLSYLVRFGRIAEVTIKGAQGPQLAHLRRSANVSNEPNC